MTQQLKGATVIAAVSLVCIGLQLGFNIQTGLAGLFIMGMAAGLVIGDQMTRDAKSGANAMQPK